MSKYIQHIIPETKSIWNNITNIADVRKAVYEYYRLNIMGETIINKDKGHKILFTNKPGGRKIAFGGSFYKQKAEAVKIITGLMKEAKYNNWGSPKKTDKKYVIGYLNYKAIGKIDGKIYYFRIAVQLRKDGNMYYNHEINIMKKK